MKNSANDHSSNIKPIYVMNQKGVTDPEKIGILLGISELLTIANVPSGLKIVDNGVWRKDDYLSGLSFSPYKSVDWYIERGMEKSLDPGQVDAPEILHHLSQEPWRDQSRGGKDHYDVLILKDDLGSSDSGFVVGSTHPKSAIVISTYRFQGLEPLDRFEVLKTVGIHEGGHLFGLLPESRTENVEYRLGKHCSNACSMRQGMIVPHDWVEMTADRLEYGALCGQCENDLKDYFRT
jgi:predicted Zn-dependent protease